MSDRANDGLNSAAFRQRLRQPERGHSFDVISPSRQPIRRKLNMDDVHDAQRIRPVSPKRAAVPRPRLLITPPPLKQQTLHIVQPQPFVEPAQRRQQSSEVLQRRSVHFPKSDRNEPKKTARTSRKLQLTLAGMAAIVFVVGMATSLQTIKTNHAAAAQVAALARKANNPASAAGNAVPSTTKPTPSAVSNYIVAPNLPRYLKIPALGVDARVTQVGVTSTGALGTPSNVFDTAWYTGSAEPGQPGATLIDGHVSSWTTHGVFYGLKTLVSGDSIQVVRGDGAVFNYQVVKTQVYAAGNVDMQAAMTPITAGKSGLNLITCTGDVIKGTSLFNQRIIIFAQQV